MYRLKDKVVLITWASSWIWEATAIEFANQWCRVIVNYNKNKNWALKVQKHINDNWWEGVIIKANVWNYNEIDSMFDEIISKFWTIDILINNAWIIWPYDNFEKINFQEIENLFKVNLLWAMYCTQKTVQILKEQNKKWVVLINSSIHWNHERWWETMLIPYCISKAGLNNFAWMLAKDVWPNIRVNAVWPWPVATPIWDEDSQETKDYFKERTLIKRWIEPEEIADTFVFLAKNEAITWQIFYVDWWFKA